MTKVSTNTTLYQTYILFSFLFSVRFLRERVTVTKACSIILTLVGIVIVGIQSQSSAVQGVDSVLGIALTVLSAILYSLTQLYFGLKVQPHIRCHTSFHIFVFSGMQGVVSFVVLLPLCCTIWHFAGLETFEIPPLFAGVVISVNGLCYLLYVPLMLLAIQWTNPSFVGVGCALTIPLSIMVDFASRGISPSLLQVGGSLVTFLGVVGYSHSLKKETAPLEGYDNESASGSKSVPPTVPTPAATPVLPIVDSIVLKNV
jgi:drug/metabolite transporter (DMT)-like permease